MKIPSQPSSMTSSSPFTIHSSLLLILISIYLYSCSFSEKTTRQLFEKSKDKSYDMVVVPGVQFEDSSWSETMQARILWSKYLYDKGIAKNIMYSGSSVYSPYYEGIIMALYAEALGIPKEHVFSETKAEHSTENIYYSYKKAKKLGYKTIALASDEFQTKLLRRYSRKVLDTSIAMIPMVRDSIRLIFQETKEPKINFGKAYNPNFKSIKERETFRQRFRGTRGKNVDVKAYEE
ncbi:MAG: YdcF family protein [Bacteroidetes bacterium]|nr:YdcF family protein [Bacteroidota bacterium]